MRRQVHTTLEAVFYRHGRDPLVVEPSWLVSAESQTRMGRPSGWTLELKAPPKAGWAGEVREADWARLVVVKNGRRYLMACGPVARVGLSIAAGGAGEGRVTYRVEGDGVDGPLDSTPIYFNPYDPLNDNALGVQMLGILDGVVEGTADELVVRMITGMMGADGVFGGHTRLPPGLVSNRDAHWVDLLDVTTVVQPGLRGRVYAPSALVSASAPSVRSFVSAWSNPVLNELWVDTAPADVSEPVAYLHLRERPFVNATDLEDSPWFGLQAWDVDADGLTGLDLTRGEGRVNHLTVTGDLAPTLGKDAYALYPPIVDVSDVELRGLRRLEQETRYFDEPGARGFGAAYREWYSLVLSWNVLAHRYWSGRLSLGELRPEVRVGQKVRILNGPVAGCRDLPSDGGDPSKALSFYVEGVMHRWVEGERPMAVTQLMASRGYVEGERVAAVVDRHGVFTGLDGLGGGSADASTLTGSEGPSSDTSGGRYA